MIARNIERSILASTVDDNHLVIYALQTDCTEQGTKRPFFVQGRDDNGNHLANQYGGVDPSYAKEALTA
jgi:hypothetical protein